MKNSRVLTSVNELNRISYRMNEFLNSESFESLPLTKKVWIKDNVIGWLSILHTECSQLNRIVIDNEVFNLEKLKEQLKSNENLTNKEIENAQKDWQPCECSGCKEEEERFDIF